MSALDHAKVVLAGIVPDRRDLLLAAFQHLEPEHFANEVQRNLYMMLERYYNVAADILPAATLTDLLGRSGTVDASKRLLYEQTYAEITAMPVSEHEFRYAVDALKDLRAKKLTGEAITTAFEVLERGVEVQGEELRGHADARRLLFDQLGDVEKMSNREEAPEGDIRKEADAVRAEYALRKSGTAPTGVFTGVPEIDRATDGFGNGELILVTAYTGEGKSQLVTQTAWNAAVMQGKNVFFATSETLRAQVRRRLLARHSRLPQFALEEGINARDIKQGRLSPAEEIAFEAVLDDLGTNPAYGRLHVAQIPQGGTLSYVETRLRRAQQQWNIDLVVIDYLALLKNERSRTSEREEFNEIIRSAKTLAASFDSGRGVPVVSPWQMRQTKYEDALRTGEYTLASLSDTSEAEKSADQIVTLLGLPDAPGERRVKFLKVRDGDVPPSFTLAVDFRTSYLGSRRAASARDDVESLLHV